jgi:uncharacterized OB-fold protein
MNMDTLPYPQPKSDLINEPFLEGWRNGRLLLQQCDSCQRSYFYPRPLCPHCWSDELSWREANGRAVIVSFSLVYRPNHSSFFDETPIILAEVRLAEGVSMLARVICDDSSVVYSGLQLKVLPPNEATRYPLPTFRPTT